MCDSKISKKLNMQPGDAADYDDHAHQQYAAEARAYFESLRQPFEQTLASIRKDRPGLMLRITLFIFLFAVLDMAFLSTRAVSFVFHQTTYSFLGKTHEITTTAGLNLVWCFIGLALFGSILHSVAQQIELSTAVKLLSAKAMVFVLSYAIVRELDSFERTKLPHHHRKAVEYWTKMLIYLRWCLQGRMSGDDAHFHALPSTTDYPVAANAEWFAKTLNWDEVRKPEYDVAAALNNIHARISARLEAKMNLGSLRIVFQSLGNFFYTTVVERREGEAVWGYGELLTAINIINGMPAMRKPAAQKRVWVLSPTLFTHSNIVVAFLAWWLVFQTLFVVLVSTSFRFFPTLTMNSQAMVGLIAAPIAAAISMVGISRKSS